MYRDRREEADGWRATRRDPSVGWTGESTWEGLDNKGWYSIVSATSQGIFSLLLYLVRRQKEEQLQEKASRAKSKRDGAAAALFLLLLPTGDVCLSPILSPPPYVRNVQSRAEQSRAKRTAGRLVVFDTRGRTHIHWQLRVRTPFSLSLYPPKAEEEISTNYSHHNSRRNSISTTQDRTIFSEIFQHFFWGGQLDL